MQIQPRQSARGIAWERSRMDRLVSHYQSANAVPVRERPLDIDLVSRLWLCLRREGYGQEDEQRIEDEE
jgi:hypothetical protein